MAPWDSGTTLSFSHSVQRRRSSSASLIWWRLWKRPNRNEHIMLIRGTCMRPCEHVQVHKSVVINRRSRITFSTFSLSTPVQLSTAIYTTLSTFCVISLSRSSQGFQLTADHVDKMSATTNTVAMLKILRSSGLDTIQRGLDSLVVSRLRCVPVAR